VPNLVHHDLKITGPELELDRFLETCFSADADGPQLDFFKLIPLPEGATRDDARKHWGVDRVAFFTEVSRLESGAIKLKFETAWAIPKPIYEEIAKRFPLLTFEGEIFELDMCWGGDLRIEGGEIGYSDKSAEIEARVFGAEKVLKGPASIHQFKPKGNKQ